MDTKHNRSCINLEIGELIDQYEMKQLSEAQRDLFENHLMDCEFCLQELEEMAPMASFLRENQVEIIRLLDKEEKDIAASIRKFYMNPIIVAALVIHYGAFRAGSESDTEEEQRFIQAREAIKRKDYKGAINILKKLTKESDEKWEYWLQLGIEYYSDRQAKDAIKVLKEAIELNESLYDSHWWLALAYLAEGFVEKGLKELNWLCDNASPKDKFHKEAKKQIRKVNEIMKASKEG
ncbi:MAG: hypothetical protein P9X24_17980 [Candidatus Hatepunaea meridiana]|nr:hypothetical protein [Candidatus Hatepunaea meridiana]